MKKITFTLAFLIIIGAIISACYTKMPQLSANESIEKNVRHYFSMGDTVDLDINVTDTIYIDELTAMQENVIKNFNYAQADIDTLNHVIEHWQNKMFDLQDNNGNDIEIKKAENMMLSYELNQADTKLKQLGYKNSNRIFMNLQRATIGKISGYELEIVYKTPSDSNTLTLLLDATYRVVD